MLIKNNPLLKGVSGMLGKTFVVREWRGRQVMSNRPKKRKSISEKQKASNENFKKAAQYANLAMTDPVVAADYKKGINFKTHSAKQAALRDYLVAPTIDYIKVNEYKGVQGDTITIKAIDDFRVVKVTVEIIDGNGEVLEQGDAVRYVRKKYIWKYRTSLMNNCINGTEIKVAAFDRPGNRADKTEEIWER